MPPKKTQKKPLKKPKAIGRKIEPATGKTNITYQSVETTWENGSGQTRQVRIKDGKGEESITTPEGKTVKKRLKKSEVDQYKQRNLDDFFPKLLIK